MKSFKLLLPLCLLMTFIFSSCGSKHKDQVFDLLPVKTKKDATKISLVDFDGKMIIEDEFDEKSKIYPTNDVITEITKEGKAKYWKLDEKKVKPLFKDDKTYEGGTPFYEDYAIVRDKEGILSLIDKKGTAVLPNLSKIKEYDVIRVGVMSDGLIRFKTTEGKWGYTNKSGDVIIKPIYTQCENFSNGKARVINEKSEFQIIDKSGVQVFKGQEDSKYLPVSDDQMIFATVGKEKTYYGLTDLKGTKKIKDNKYTNASWQLNAGLIAVKSEDDSKWGVISTKDAQVVGDLRFKFDNAPVISKSGRVIASIDKKLKLYNQKGELVTALDDYSVAVPISENRFLALIDNDKNGRFDLIDEEGKMVGKDSYFWALNANEHVIENLQSPEVAMNEFTIESTYFNFEKLFQTTFVSITTNDIVGIDNSSSIESVLQKFPNTENNRIAASISKYDDYEMVFSTSSISTETAATTTETAVPTAATYSVSDNYPFLSLYSQTYSTQKGLDNFKFTFGFDNYIKTETYNSNTSQFVYDINPSAHVTSVSVDFGNLNGNKTLKSKLREKLIGSGWKTNDKEDASSNYFTNSVNGNNITLTNYSLTFLLYSYPSAETAVPAY